MSDKALTFLYEARKIVPKTQCGTFIRCQLLAKCHSLTGINLPAQNFKTSIICQGCGIELADVPPQTHIKSPPKRTRLIKKIEKLIEKRKSLTSHLRNIYDSFVKNNFQQLVTKCQLCNYKNVIKMNKPEFKTQDPQFITQQKKKKKKKNQFAGLNKSAVLSVSTSSLNKSFILLENNKNSPKASTQNGPNKNEQKNSEFIPLDMPGCSMSITKNVATDDRNVNLVRNNNNGIHNVNAKRYFSVQNDTKNSTNNNKGKRSINNQNNQPKNKKKDNKFKNNRVQKNEVLRKTEKNYKKNDKKLKNLASMLNRKEGQSSSLANFLKNTWTPIG